MVGGALQRSAHLTASNRTMSFNWRLTVAFRAFCLTAVVLLLFLAISSNAYDAEFSNIGAFKAMCTASGSMVTISVVNLGHCTALCAASSTCTIVNYLLPTRSCQLLFSTTTGVITWSPDTSSQMLMKVDLIGDVVPETAQMQPIAGTQLQSGRAEGYTSYSLQRAINAMHCWRLCSAITGGLCRMFAYHASLLSCLVYDVDFYTTWTTASVSDPGWTSYYAKQTDGWKLLYKISKGIGVDASSTFFSGPTTTTGSSAQMAMDSTCGCFLRSSIIDNWTQFPITSVSVILATGGVPMKYLNFSTTATDMASTFFTASKISASSWTDLSSSTALWYMNIGTTSSNLAGRYYLIVKDRYAGCNVDKGWISVNGQGTAACSYDIKPVPQFAYSSGSTWTYFTSAAFADALLIYAKM